MLVGTYVGKQCRRPPLSLAVQQRSWRWLQPGRDGCLCVL